MPDEKKKIENAAEKTGEAVGKMVKKGAKAVKVIRGYKERNQEKIVKNAKFPFSIQRFFGVPHRKFTSTMKTADRDSLGFT